MCQEYSGDAIGSDFMVAASLGMLLLAGDPHGDEHLSELRSGQVLWATPGQAAQIAALYAILPALAGRKASPRMGLLTGGFWARWPMPLASSPQPCLTGLQHLR